MVPAPSVAAAPRGIALAPGRLRLRLKLLTFSRRGAEIAEADSILNLGVFAPLLFNSQPFTLTGLRGFPPSRSRSTSSAPVQLNGVFQVGHLFTVSLPFLYHFSFAATFHQPPSSARHAWPEPKRFARAREY